MLFQNQVASVEAPSGGFEFLLYSISSANSQFLVKMKVTFISFLLFYTIFSTSTFLGKGRDDSSSRKKIEQHLIGENGVLHRG